MASSALTTVPPLAHALAGAVGGIVSMGLLFPLDQIRTLFQVDDELARECKQRGVRGLLRLMDTKYGKGSLYRGVAPVLFTMGISNFVFFYLFSGLKALFLFSKKHKLGLSLPGSRSGPVHISVLESTVVSLVAGVVNVLATTPLWVANTRIKTRRGAPQDAVGGSKRSGGLRALFSTLSDTYRAEGVAGLWSGTMPSLFLVSNPIIQFVFYERIKRAILSSRSADGTLHGHEAFLLGAAAKAVATVATYPLQLAQTKLRAQASREQEEGGDGGENEEMKKSDGRGKGQGGQVSQSSHSLEADSFVACWRRMVGCLVEAFRERGVAGLFQGVTAKLLHTVLTAAFTFLTYEKVAGVIARALFKQAQGRRLER